MRLLQAWRIPKGTAVAAAGLLAWGVCAPGQEAHPSPDPATFHVSTDYVMVDALVLDQQTKAPVGGLEASDFRLTEDGQEQPIRYFSRDELPLSIVFLFDITDSVRPALRTLASQAQMVLGRLKPQDEVAVMTFSSHADLLQGFTTDRKLAAAAIEKAAAAKTGEATFIFEDVYQGADEAMKTTLPGSRRVLVFFTDGTSNFDNPFTKLISKSAPAQLHTGEEATEHLMRSGAVVAELVEVTPITDFVVADPMMWAMGAGARIGDVAHLADQTGGPVLHTKRAEAPERMAALLDLIRQRYTLGYKPLKSAPAGTFCRIVLQLRPEASARLRLRKVAVRARVGYYR